MDQPVMPVAIRACNAPAIAPTTTARYAELRASDERSGRDARHRVPQESVSRGGLFLGALRVLLRLLGLFLPGVVSFGHGSLLNFVCPRHRWRLAFCGPRLATQACKKNGTRGE